MAKIVEFCFLPIDKINASVQCARIHYSELLKKSVQEFGFVEPLIIDKNFRLVCGKLKYLVAKQLGIMEMPCIVVDFTDVEADKFRLVANKVGEKSNWNWCELNNELVRIGDDLERYELSDNDGSEEILGIYQDSIKSNQQNLF